MSNWQKRAKNGFAASDEFLSCLSEEPLKNLKNLPRHCNLGLALFFFVKPLKIYITRDPVPFFKRDARLKVVV